MKKFYILTVTFLSGVSMMAANGDALTQGLTAPRTLLKAVDISKYDVKNPRKAALKTAAKAEADAPARLTAPRMEAKGQKKTLDKVECTYSSTGEPYSLQEFKFDSHGWPVKRVNSLYDAATQQYVAAEEYAFEWNEDGLCTSQWQTSSMYNMGLRYDYKYNGQGLGVEQVYYEYDFSGAGKWVAMQKNEYEYDDRGNITKETVYLAGSQEGQWTVYSTADATWYDDGQMKSYAYYLWDGSQWQGVDERYEYAWAAKDKMTRCKSYTWQNGEWVFYCDLVQEFDKNLNQTLREKRFYNAELDNWNGCCTWNGSTYTNERTVNTYDDLGHMLTSDAYGMSDAQTGEWELGAWERDTWTQTDDGGWRNDYAGYLGDLENYTDSYAGTELYDKNGWQTYGLDKMYNYMYGKLFNDQEIIKTYNENGDVLTEKSYTFDSDEANTRQGNLWVENEYDELYNIIGTVNRMQGSMGTPFGAPATRAGEDSEDDGIDWQYTTKFEYFYEQDTVRVKKLGYKWQNGDWEMNQGETTTYDYDTPVEDIIAWPGLNTYHTIAQTSSLDNNNSGDWLVFNYTYSDFTSGISKPAAGGEEGIRVWPTLVDDGFNVDAPEGTAVRVYSMSGACVAETRPGYVGMPGMPKGVYIVTAGGVNTKIVKK